MPVLCLDWFGLKSYSSNNGLLVLAPAVYGTLSPQLQPQQTLKQVPFRANHQLHVRARLRLARQGVAVWCGARHPGNVLEGQRVLRRSAEHGDRHGFAGDGSVGLGWAEEGTSSGGHGERRRAAEEHEHRQRDVVESRVWFSKAVKSDAVRV